MNKARDLLHQKRKPIIIAGLLVIASGIMLPEKETGASPDIRPISIPIQTNAPEKQASEPGVLPIYQEIRYTIESGDTLGAIFNKLDIPPATMYRLLEADESFVLLDNLMPGQSVLFVREGDNKLVTRMQLTVNQINTLEFIRDGDGYSGTLKIHETEHIERSVRGVINNNLYVSAIEAGLSPLEIDTFSRLFEDKINFARDLRAGDTFRILFNDIYVDDEPTGQSILKGVVFNNKGKLLREVADKIIPDYLW